MDAEFIYDYDLDGDYLEEVIDDSQSSAFGSIEFTGFLTEAEEDYIYDELSELLNISSLEEEFSPDYLMLEGELGGFDFDSTPSEVTTALSTQLYHNGVLALSEYTASDESSLVANRMKRFNNLIRTVKHEQSYLDVLQEELYRFLRGAECKAIPGEMLAFQSKEYGNDGNFHTFLVNRVLSLLQKTDWCTAKEPDLTKIYESVDDILVKEKIYLKPEQVIEMRIAVSKFGKFFETLYYTYYSRESEPGDIVQRLHILAPLEITATGYLCGCGAHVQQEGMVPLTVLIGKRPGKYDFMMNNTPFQCPQCNTFLAIPEHVVKVVEPILIEIIRGLEISIKSYALYRPPIAEIASRLPSDIAPLFNFEVEEYYDVPDDGAADKAEYATMYVNLTTLWMRTLLKTLEPPVSDIAIQSDLLGTMSSLAEKSYASFDTLDVSYDLSDDYYGFVKTLIHYLESLGCFALTYKGQAYYRYCQLANLKRYCYTTEEAMRWLHENAWSIVGLKSVVSGSFRGGESLDLLPEFVPVFNCLFQLRVLANTDNTRAECSYSSWKNRPNTVKSRDFISQILKKSKASPILHMVATSTRRFKNFTHSYSPDVFVDVYTLLNELVTKGNMDSYPINNAVLELASEAMFSSSEEFYGIELDDKNYMVSPIYRFNDFKTVFNESGWLIFHSSLSTQKTIERARVLTLIFNAPNPTKSLNYNAIFEPSSIPRTNSAVFLKPQTISEEDRNRLLQEIIFLSDDALPEDLLLLREQLSRDEFLKVIADSQEVLREDGRLFEKFPEVFA